jgi:hypothetical protein
MSRLLAGRRVEDLNEVRARSAGSACGATMIAPSTVPRRRQRSENRFTAFSGFAIYLDRVEQGNRLDDIDTELVRAERAGTPGPQSDRPGPVPQIGTDETNATDRRPNYYSAPTESSSPNQARRTRSAPKPSQFSTFGSDLGEEVHFGSIARLVSRNDGRRREASDVVTSR